MSPNDPQHNDEEGWCKTAMNYTKRSLGPINKALDDRLILGGITHQPYAIAAHLLNHMAEANQEIEKDFMLAALMTQMDELALKIVEIEVQCKRKDKYVPPHERRKPKDNEGKGVEGMLSIILDKIHSAAREPYGSCDASSQSDTKQGVAK
uniref:Polyprotein protein n=1 Tax=Solanum tuberosum TaxID=4113 RepID=M1DHA5_SOLTU